MLIPRLKTLVGMQEPRPGRHCLSLVHAEVCFTLASSSRQNKPTNPISHPIHLQGLHCHAKLVTVTAVTRSAQMGTAVRRSVPAEHATADAGGPDRRACHGAATRRATSRK